MGAYDDSTRLAWLAIQDMNTIAAESIGLMVAEYAVQLATETIIIPEDKAKGIPATTTIVYQVLSPRPVVSIKTQFRSIDGAQVKVGDVLVTMSRGTVTRAQVEAASWIEVGGERYTTIGASTALGGVPGAGITELPFSLEVILEREQQ